MKCFTFIPDSFVGVITNSSSELFVLEDQKSAEFVESIISELIRVYNKQNKTHYTYESCFKKPEVCKYHFDYFKAPDTWREKYERLKGCNYKLTRHVTPFTNSVYDLKQSGETDSWFKAKRKALQHGLSEKEAEWKASSKDRLKDSYVAKLFSCFLEQNDLADLIEPFWTAWRKFRRVIVFKKRSLWAQIYFEDGDPLKEPWEFFSFAESWQIPIRKNSIWVSTLSDNSAPYKIFGAINSLLNGENWHLG